MVKDLLSATPPAVPSTSATAALASEGRGDGLLIVSKGLGLRHVILAFLQIHADPRNLVLLINTPAREVECLREDLMAVTAARGGDGEQVKPQMMRAINNETPANERAELYLSGGVLAITSRILVVDMLNKVLPLHLVTGIMVNHAHRFHVSVTEAIEENGHADLVELRVPLTQHMKDIQAALVECIEQCLAELKRSNPSLDAEDFTVENAFFRSFDNIVRQQLDPIWHRIGPKSKQLAGDLKTLRKLLRYLFQCVTLNFMSFNVECLTTLAHVSYLVSYDCVTFNSFLETIMTSNTIGPSAVFRSEAAQSQWLLLDAAHAVFAAARNRVYNKVTGALGNLEEGIPPGVEPVLEEQPKWRVLKEVMREIEAERKAAELNGEGTKCSFGWLYCDSVKLNVNGFHSPATGPVLIMVDGDRTCNQLREVLSGCDFTTIKPEAEDESSAAIAGRKPRDKKKRKRQRNDALDPNMEDKGEDVDGDEQHQKNSRADGFCSEGTEKLLKRLLRNYFRWKGGLPRVAKNLSQGGPSAAETRSSGGRPPGAPRGAARGGSRGSAPPNKRRRVRGGSVATTSDAGRRLNTGNGETGLSLTFEQEAAEVAAFLSQSDPTSSSATTTASHGGGDDEFDASAFSTHYGLIDPNDLVVIRPYSSTSSSIAGGSVSNGDDDARALEELKPRWIVMYDPDVGFVRRVEVFKAQNPHCPLKVYFMVYDNSVEEQRYLSQIRKEKSAFEKLIREKSIMAIPIDQDGRIEQDVDEAFWQKLDTRLAGGQRIPASESRQIIVDVREFRSSLPSLLHARRMNLRPCTLEVGDYVLSPLMCVERKSISDLIQSLKSGRLYTQCEAMCLHYQLPVLLIEFDKDKAFSLSTAGEIRGEISGWDVGSRLSLLVLTFPKLRIIWSSSSAATAEIFEDLKLNQDEPDMKDAMSVGVSNMDTIDSAYSITPSDVLRSLPGITSKNYRHVMSKATNLKELSEWSLEQCQEVIGQEFGRMLYAFFRKNAKTDT
ncbi:hypothetical protein HK104_010313 [Borealophlyctis nickersoniae]|nr:hypothetical protein HK104_010313 [Borealophlyctis nickersoniae]